MMETDQRSFDFNQKTISFISSLRAELNLKQQNELLDTLGWTNNDLKDFFAGTIDLCAIQFYNLSKKFNFSIKAFYENKIDFEALGKFNAGKRDHLPTKYKTELGTKNFIFSLSLEYLELTLGPKHKQNIVNYLQLPSIHDASGNIGVKASDDLNQYLDSFGFTKKDYFSLGYYCISRIMQTFFQDTSKLPTNKEEYLKWFFEVVRPKWVEQNSIYKVKMDKNRIDVVAHINPLLEDKFAKEVIGSKSQCAKKVGGFKALIDYYHTNKTEVTHPKCLYNGDDECLYSFNF